VLSGSVSTNVPVPDVSAAVPPPPQIGVAPPGLLPVNSHDADHPFPFEAVL